MPSRKPTDTATTRVMSLLKRLYADLPASEQFELLDTIGVGGMGIVHKATQKVLGRTVALKTLRSDQRNRDNVSVLLREAWVAGSLDHPNVVPIHDISLDDSGYPLMVLKRIEGQAWSELMFDDRRVRERFGADDLLEWNLGILSQVLNAVRYAHSRGIVHRDLKPDNVMIGEFGEVYLVDWGIAISLDADKGFLPTASEATEFAGTPCYMAPEMLGDGDEPISELTDIYLIGAILYEILTGQPPHLGDDTPAIIDSIKRSDPELPESVPFALTRICRRAMDPDPSGRFENAEQVRLALRGFMQHRGSARLAMTAIATLGELEKALSAGAVSDAEHRQELYRMYGACRFGFQEALSSWPGNDTARDGLERATTAMVEYELAQGDARAAAALCANLDPPPVDLLQRIERASRTAAAEKVRYQSLKEMAHKLDMSVGQGVRVGAILFVGAVATMGPLLIDWCFGHSVVSAHSSLMMWTGSVTVICLLMGLVLWRSLEESVINRRLWGMQIAILMAQLLLEIALWRADVTPARSMLMHAFMWFFSVAGVSITIDKRLAPACACYLGVFFALSEYPGWELEAFTLPHIVLVVNAVVIWRPHFETGLDPSTGGHTTN